MSEVKKETGKEALTSDQMRTLANSFLRYSEKHLNQIRSNPLPYIDVLIDAVWKGRAIATWQVVNEVNQIMPGVTRGTISKIVELKEIQRKMAG